MLLKGVQTIVEIKIMKNIRVTCFIQQGAFGDSKILKLESVLTSVYQGHFGRDFKLTFCWISIPYEQSYIAGELSNASTVQMPVEDGTPDPLRHEFMREVCDKWQKITHCSKDEIILVSPNMAKFKAFDNKLMNRFAKSSRRSTKLKMVARMLAGKLKKGYLNTSVNL